jgi:hypothetical protein
MLNILITTIKISIAIPRKKTGIIIFIGMAARFVTNVISIATIAGIIRSVFVPDKVTAITVRGVKKHPIIRRPMASMPILFSWCSALQFKNLLKSDRRDPVLL